jgi:tRNA A-37 threonylcarbamoyl transferase component Bud32/GAF domain-containing protein
MRTTLSKVERSVAMRSEPRRPAFFWLVLAACVLYAVAFSLTAYVSIRHYGTLKAPGWNVRAERAGWFVTDIDMRGPAAGRLEDGDRLLAINGDERSAIVGASYWRNVRGGAAYRLDVERRGERMSVELPLPLGPGRPFDNVFTFYALVFFACGAALGLVRPRDGQVRLVALCLMLFGFGTLSATLATIRGLLEGWETLAYFAIVAPTSLVFPMTYHVFCRFPTGQHPGSLWQAMQWLLYALFGLVFWPAWILHYLGVDIGARATQFLVDHPSLYLTATRVTARESWGYFVLCLVLAMVVTARNYRRLHDPDSRRRIRVVVAGLLIALIPFAAATFTYRFAGVMSEDTYRTYVGPIAFLPMICIPISLAAAVWKEQLFDIRVIVRRGLQYLFARAALRAMLALPIALLVFSIASHPDRTVAQILTQGSGWLNIVWIGVIAAALPARQRLQTSLDRRFFREAYHQEQVLVQLIDEVRQRDSLADIARLVSAQIDSVLHPTTLHIFYRAEERSNRFEGHSSSDVLVPRQLSEQHTLLALIGDATAIREFPSDCEGKLPPSERDWLEKLGVRLIVPIIGTRERLVGVLLLGLRMSDQPYSATDRRLLQGIASQIGLVYENQHLKERARRDADVRRDVLARLDERSISLLKECPVCGVCYESAADRCEQDGSELALTLPIERTLDGKYRLERALGRGGFGAVFEASDLRLQRLVAAKVMMGSLFGDPVALRRFEREARAAAKIDHPSITRVHDYGAVGSGGAYLIMELVAGRTWRAELQRSGVIAPARASEWFRQLLDGLQFAHARGIVHRDLKPENVMIVATSGGGDALKIMDFGLAKVLDAGTGVTESVTVAGMAMGTLGYMAPEVLTGGLVDERADIFAIGVMVVETLTGARPFGGQTQQEILLALLQREYHLPGESAEIRALDAIVQGCLAKDARDRYGSAAELAKDLVPALARCGGFGAHHGVTMSDSPTLG